MVHVLKVIQEFSQSKAKDSYIGYDSKIGRYKRPLTTLQHLQQRRPRSVDLATRISDVGKMITDIQTCRSHIFGIINPMQDGLDRLIRFVKGFFNRIILNHISLN